MRGNRKRKAWYKIHQSACIILYKVKAKIDIYITDKQIVRVMCTIHLSLYSHACGTSFPHSKWHKTNSVTYVRYAYYTAWLRWVNFMLHVTDLFTLWVQFGSSVFFVASYACNYVVIVVGAMSLSTIAVCLVRMVIYCIAFIQFRVNNNGFNNSIEINQTIYFIRTKRAFCGIHTQAKHIFFFENYLFSCSKPNGQCLQ